MTLTEFLTIVAIIFGPVAAVLISLWNERRRKRHEQKLSILRMLMNTRAMPSDPAWSVAVNLVPIEFNDDRKVMKAWREYMEAVRYKASPENEQTANAQSVAKQIKLIHQVLKSMDLEISETDLQTEAYLATAYVERDNLYLNSLAATADIARTLQEQTEILRAASKGSDSH